MYTQAEDFAAFSVWLSTTFERLDRLEVQAAIGALVRPGGGSRFPKCYPCSTMQQIGVRELRQQASRYLKRVQAGEAFEVTDNGRPVARLVPVPPDPWQALIDSGQVIAADLPGGLLNVQPRDFGIDASGELAAMRALEDR